MIVSDNIADDTFPDTVNKEIYDRVGINFIYFCS